MTASFRLITFAILLCIFYIINMTLTNAANVVTATKSVRIIALHGRGCSGLIFKKKMEPLINMIPQSSLSSSYHIEWYFPNAPHIHDSQPTIKSSIPSSASTPAIISSSNSNQQQPQYEWWSLPPRTRSFNATEYYGVDESIQLIENFRPHILIGHSQGAMLTSIVIAKAINQMSSATSTSTSSTSLEKSNIYLPKLAILSCPAFPQPYGKLLHSVNTLTSHDKNTNDSDNDDDDDEINGFKTESTITSSIINNTNSNNNTNKNNKIKLLHILSKLDKTNPYESGLKVVQSFQQCPLVTINQLMTHDQGHKLCMDESFVQIYTDLILQTINDIDM